MAKNLESFELTDCEFIKGNPVKLSELKGKQACVVEMWATWCPPCRDSIPHVSALQKQFPNICFIGMTDEKAAVARPFVEKMGSKMEYRVCVDSTRSAYTSYMQAVGAQGIPTAFVINKAGRIVWSGHPSDAEFEAVLTRVQSEPGVAESVHVPRTAAELTALKVSALRAILDHHNVRAEDCIEKADLVARIMDRIVSKMP